MITSRRCRRSVVTCHGTASEHTAGPGLLAPPAQGRSRSRPTDADRAPPGAAVALTLIWRTIVGKHLVTGATGLIGSVIAQQLVEAGHDVVARVRPGTDASALEAIGVRIARGDLIDPGSVREAIVGCDGAFHSAAIVGTPNQNRAASEQVNVGGTITLLDAARETGVARVVAISTSGVFDSDMTLTEQTPVHPNPPDDPYTQTKVKAYQETMRRVEGGQDVVLVLPGATTSSMTPRCSTSSGPPSWPEPAWRPAANPPSMRL